MALAMTGGGVHAFGNGIRRAALLYRRSLLASVGHGHGGIMAPAASATVLRSSASAAWSSDRRPAAIREAPELTHAPHQQHRAALGAVVFAACTPSSCSAPSPTTLPLMLSASSRPGGHPGHRPWPRSVPDLGCSRSTSSRNTRHDSPRSKRLAVRVPLWAGRAAGGGGARLALPAGLLEWRAHAPWWHLGPWRAPPAPAQPAESERHGHPATARPPEVRLGDGPAIKSWTGNSGGRAPTSSASSPSARG